VPSDLVRDLSGVDGLLQDVSEYQGQLIRLPGSEILFQEILDEIELGFQYPVVCFHHGRAEYEQSQAEISRTRLGSSGVGRALYGQARVREHFAERITQDATDWAA
jgi:hypothetical protein